MANVEVGQTRPLSRRRPVIRAGLTLGVGLGGFVDGIVLHQILHWHQMLSARVPPVDVSTMKFNMFWDGAFHGVLWLVLAVGLKQLWNACASGGCQGQGRTLIGAMVLGWGVLNLVEGLVNHHLLELHHVHDMVVNKVLWDVSFLGLSAGIAGAGARLIWRPRADR